MLFLILTGIASGHCRVLASAKDEALQAEFRALGKAVPAELIRQGIRSFSGLSLKKYFQQVDAVQLRIVDSHELHGVEGRRSARWKKVGTQKYIYVTRDFFALKDSETKQILSFHEYLGVLGYDDDEYWLSVTLWYLTWSKAESVLSRPEFESVLLWAEELATRRPPVGTQLAGGGVVGVGGGGEGLEVLYRVLMLKDLTRRLGKGSADRVHLQTRILQTLSSPMRFRFHGAQP